MDTRIGFKLCHHGDRDYIQYTIIGKENTYQFHNAAYVEFDATSENFRKCTEYAGGFFANMTTRRIEELKAEKDKDIVSIMLCCIPQKTNRFLFCFLYLDAGRNIIDSIRNDNYFDYKFFYDKLKNAVSDEGVIYDLEQQETFAKITKDICPNPSLGFGIKVGNGEIRTNDVFRCNDLSIFNKKTKAILEKLEADHVLISFNCDLLHFIHLTGTVFRKDNSPILGYQAESGIQDSQEYIEHIKKELDVDDYTMDHVDTEPFHFSINLATMANLAKKLTIEEIRP